MRHILRFKQFESLEVSPTDDPEDKAAKEQVNDIEKHLKEYSTIKSEIDQAFANIKGNEELNDKIEEISGKHKGNPLIDEYIRVAALQKKVLATQEELAKYTDDIFIASEELKELSRSKADSASIAEKTKTIANMKKAYAAKNSEIASFRKQAAEAEKNMKKKMAELKKDSTDNMSSVMEK